MLQDKQRGVVRYRHDSLEAVAHYIAATPRRWRSESSKGRTGEYGKYAWTLGASYDDALKLARDGWQEGAKRMATGLVRLPAIDSVPDYVFDVAGYLPDVGRYCAGMPDNMLRYPDEEMGSKPVLTLAVNVCANWTTNADYMANFGLAVARYVDELEASGYRVELLAGTVTTDGTRVVNVWTVKRAADAMNLASVAFSIGHPAAFRRLGFALLERSAVPQMPGYGVAVDLKLSDIIDATAGCIVLNGMKDANSIARTPEDALAFIGKQIDAVLNNYEAESVA